VTSIAEIEQRIEEIKREIVHQQRRLKDLDPKDVMDQTRVTKVRDRIAALEQELLALEDECLRAKQGRPTMVPETSTPEASLNLPTLAAKPHADDLIKSIQDYSEKMLFERYADKYCSEYYYQRAALRAHFSDFLESARSAMVITGKAGIGKSAFVCDLVDNPPDNCLIWLQDCAYLQLGAKMSIDEYIGRSMGLTSGVLATLDDLLEQHPTQRIVFAFDSVNEYSNREELLTRLARFVRDIEDRRIKLILTCRMPMWRSIGRAFAIPANRGYHIAGPGSNVLIDPFSEEEIERAYGGYRQAYHIKTPYSELSPQVKHFILQPLFLNLTAVVCSRGEVPKSLALRDVFSQYVEKCLGEGGFESEEFAVLQRIIELMYEQAKRELELALVKRNGDIGHYVVPDFNSPYAKLIDEGLLSERVEQKVIRRVQLVFVTYERVFEFLLAEIIVGDVTVEEILRNLELAQTKPFIQLRGAVELALSFSVLSGDVDESLLIGLARLNRPDSRQFVCDVIQTIYDSGHRDRAEEIVFRISKDVKPESKFLAVQAAYHLALDEQLLRLALDKDPDLRDLATVYVYERWNAARLAGHLDKGYGLLHSLRSHLGVREPKRAVHAIQALVSVGANMMIHLVDDPESLHPLMDICWDLINRLPAVTSTPPRDRLAKAVSEGTTNLFVEIIAQAVSRPISRYAILDNALQVVIGDPKTIRAALDVGELLSLTSLTEHRDKIVRLINWPSAFVSFIASSLTIHQIDSNPDEHLPLFLSTLDSPELGLSQRLLILRALTLGLIARMVKGNSIPEGILSTLLEYLLAYWYEMEESPPTPVSDDALAMTNPLDLWQSTLYGLLVMEADAQRSRGDTKGSTIASTLVDAPAFGTSGMKVLLKTLERTAYQDYVDFAVMSIVDKKIRRLWEQDLPEMAVAALSDIRALYQDEVDSLLQKEPTLGELWNKVKVTGYYPSPKDLRSIGHSLWLIVVIATDMQVAKAAGLCLMELAFAKSVTDYWRRLVRLVMEMLTDPIIVDIAHVEWGFAHDPEWDRFDKLEIPRDIVKTRPELHEHYRMLIESCIERCGRGIFHGEL
jgi:uncharacterized coiled-coil protein SlyX